MSDSKVAQPDETTQPAFTLREWRGLPVPDTDSDRWIREALDQIPAKIIASRNNWHSWVTFSGDTLVVVQGYQANDGSFSLDIYRTKIQDFGHVSRVPR